MYNVKEVLTEFIELRQDHANIEAITININDYRLGPIRSSAGRIAGIIEVYLSDLDQHDLETFLESLDYFINTYLIECPPCRYLRGLRVLVDEALELKSKEAEKDLSFKFNIFLGLKHQYTNASSARADTIRLQAYDAAYDLISNWLDCMEQYQLKSFATYVEYFVRSYLDDCVQSSNWNRILRKIKDCYKTDPKSEPKTTGNKRIFGKFLWLYSSYRYPSTSTSEVEWVKTTYNLDPNDGPTSMSKIRTFAYEKARALICHEKEIASLDEYNLETLKSIFKYFETTYGTACSYTGWGWMIDKIEVRLSNKKDADMKKTDEESRIEAMDMMYDVYSSYYKAEDIVKKAFLTLASFCTYCEKPGNPYFSKCGHPLTPTSTCGIGVCPKIDTIKNRWARRNKVT